MKSSRFEKGFFPVSVQETIFSDLPTRARSVDKAIIADVDADVRIFFSLFVKKKKIALPNFLRAHGAARVLQILRSVWYVQSRSQITVPHQTAAIEALGAFAAIFVGSADHRDSGPSSLLSDSRRITNNRLHRRGGAGK